MKELFAGQTSVDRNLLHVTWVKRDNDSWLTRYFFDTSVDPKPTSFSAQIEEPA